MPDTPVIEIRDLHKAYGALEVLKGVDITAQRGQVISLIGSSGSGKSTLLRCCNLLEDSQHGTIRFHGEDVTWKGTNHARRPADAPMRRGAVWCLRRGLCPRGCAAPRDFSGQRPGGDQRPRLRGSRASRSPSPR